VASEVHVEYCVVVDGLQVKYIIYVVTFRKIFVVFLVVVLLKCNY